ncbi:MAG: flagellar protein FlaG [Gammaproteobacteria bacterium]|nr:flagellar protein FlaG [Gammaproteobacteria bacterium]
MNISNLTQMGTMSPPVVKEAVASESSSPAVNGKALPAMRQVGVHSADQPTTGDTPQQNSPSAQPTSKELDQLVSQANVSLQARFSDLKFTVVNGTDINVVRIEDKETGELIRQFPSEAMVAIARTLDEFQRGTMLEEKV